MRTRFVKFWCNPCGTMRFLGDCDHGRVIAPPGNLAHVLSLAERRAPSMASHILGFARGAFRDMPDELLHKLGLRRL